MKYTSKQLAAMVRVLKRGQKEYDKRIIRDADGNKIPTVCGEIKASDGFALTDGKVVIYYNESVPALPRDTRVKDVDWFHNFLRNEICSGDYTAINAQPKAKDIRTQILLHKEAYTKVPSEQVPRCEKTLDAQLSNGKLVSSVFNAQYLFDAMEAVGHSPMLYLGNCADHPPYLIVADSETTWDLNIGTYALVLPIKTS